MNEQQLRERLVKAEQQFEQYQNQINEAELEKARLQGEHRLLTDQLKELEDKPSKKSTAKRAEVIDATSVEGA